VAWLGPAIGPGSYEVGREVYEAFLAQDAGATAAFVPRGEGKFLADLYALASRALTVSGVTSVHGGGYCTLTDRDRFFSYRREKSTGRMASLVWMD
jgi:hypothetical protein